MSYNIDKIIYITGVKDEDTGENVIFETTNVEQINDVMVAYLLSLTTNFNCSIEHEVNGSRRCFVYKVMAFDKENRVAHVYLKKAPKPSVKINQ